MGNKKTNLLSIFVLFTIFFLLKFSYIFTFPHHYQYKNIELYSDQPLQEHEEILTKALSLIEHSSIYRDDLEFTILISNSFAKYRLFNPLGSGSFAKYYPLTSNIYVNKTDGEGLTHRKSDKRTRNLHEIIAHEATHHMLFKRVDLITYLRLPLWIHEGYADYVAQSSTLTQDEARALELSNPDNMSLKYYKFREEVANKLQEGGNIEDLISQL